ncbi:Solute carrier family 35 member F4, partial [Fasciolopsis buskii]
STTDLCFIRFFCAGRITFNHSTLSLDLEDELFHTNQNMHGSNSDTIRLSDLTAPTRGCSCFHFPHWHLPKPHLPHRPRPSTSESTSNHVPQRDPMRNTVVPSAQDNDRGSGEVWKTASRTKSRPTVKITIPQSDVQQHSEAEQQSLNGRKSKYRLHIRLPEVCPPMKKWSGAQNGKRLRRFCELCLWSAITWVAVSTSMSGLAESGTRIYVNQPIPNDTQLLVKPPSFVVQFATAWLLLIYPIYLILNVFARFEPIQSQDATFTHVAILASDQPTVMKVITRCSLFSVLWQIFLHCLLRSLEAVPSIDCAAILAVLPCINYLLCWIIVHRRFCALRVIAFIMASSGVILNIYSDQELMWHKCLASIAVVALSLFIVIVKKIISRPTFGQFAAFYFGLSLFNLIVYWPIFVFTSVVTSAEPIFWNRAPWKYFVAVGVSLVVMLVSMDLSNRKVSRAVRAIQPVFAPALCILFQMVWLHRELYFTNVRLSSLVMITVACLLNAIPNRWLKNTAKALRRNRSPKTQTSTTYKRGLSNKANFGLKQGSVSLPAQRVSIVSNHGSLASGSLGLGQTTGSAQPSAPGPITSSNSSLPNAGSVNPSANVAGPGSTGMTKTRSRLSSVLLRAATAQQNVVEKDS